MEFPMEELASVLADLGFKKERLSDHELVQIASRKLKSLGAIAKLQLSEGLFEVLIND
jgi:hypothetical protein